MTASDYATAHRARFVRELREFLRFPSISTLAAHRDDVRRTAQWLADHLQTIGAQVCQVIPTPGHPVVYAEFPASVPDAPTLLFYGHYDVQPVDPLDEWTSPPFEPTERDGVLFARGATDDKGQVFLVIKAIESWLQGAGTLPCTVKLLIEGEEEIGSPNLEGFLQTHRPQLACDAVLICDTAMFAPDVPSLVYGLRGLAYLELTVQGPNRDLHSGSFGGAVVNPANALARIIAALHDDAGNIAVPGFYDDVRPLDDQERALIASLLFDEEAFQRELGVPALGGEAGYSVLERLTVRPTLDVNGLWSGFTGEGAKTVLPASAHAKISMRLVPDQRADRIAQRVAEHIERIASRGVRVSVRMLHGADPVLVDRESLPMKAAARALEQTFGRPPVFQREGGSIPVVSHFQQMLGVPVVLMGFGLHSDGAHSPNEHFHLVNFYRGIEAVARFLEELQRGA
ncbi:MAG: peptidase M20 [Chlorobi bacterium NICIL-2]|nr:MAG: peptidase M20 [Chlorobi bacterium NICIL-2]